MLANLSIINHAHNCRDSKCRVKGCHKKKRLLDHCMQCHNPSCVMCEALKNAASVHVEGCDVVKCKFPFCKNLKKINSQKHVKENDSQSQVKKKDSHHQVTEVESQFNLKEKTISCK